MNGQEVPRESLPWEGAAGMPLALPAPQAQEAAAVEPPAVVAPPEGTDFAASSMPMGLSPDERDAEPVAPEEVDWAEPGEPEEVEPELHPELERALVEFQRWFEAGLESSGEPPPVAEAPAIDLNTLLGNYLGLRQEVNLQTRAVRGQQEQNSELVRMLQQSLEAVQRSQTRSEQAEKQAADERVRPLLTSLVELHDNLSLAGREIARAHDSLLPLLEVPQTPVEEAPPRAATAAARSFWSRWILSPTAEAALHASQEQTHDALVQLHSERQRHRDHVEQARASGQRIDQALQALVTGYTMSLERIERTLRRHGLEAIPSVGEKFDPEFMEAVDTVADTGRPAGEVVEELRRGYLLNGRIFRYAQVRVARG